MTFLDLSFIHAFSLDWLTFSYGKFVSAIPLRYFAMIQTWSFFKKIYLFIIIIMTLNFIVWGSSCHTWYIL